MNRYKLSKAGVNTTEGIARFNGNADIYEEMLNEFTRDGQYKALIQAMEKQDVAGAFTAAHSLKGLAGNLSMTLLYKDISSLVDKLRSGSLQGTDVLLAAVVADYNAVIAAI